MATKNLPQKLRVGDVVEDSHRRGRVVSLHEDAGIPYARISAAHVARTRMTRE
jgi:hypothetical protein